VPWNVIADEHLRIVFLALHGNISAPDITALHSNLQSRFAGRDFVVFVHVEAAAFAIDAEALTQLAQLEPVFNKIAIYTPSPVSQEVCRAYAQTASLLHGTLTIEAFGTTTEAFGWLTNTRYDPEPDVD
jgi:hypothetical protein